MKMQSAVLIYIPSITLHYIRKLFTVA